MHFEVSKVLHGVRSLASVGGGFGNGPTYHLDLHVGLSTSDSRLVHEGPLLKEPSLLRFRNGAPGALNPKP